jgi:hypothetical protein
VRRGLETGVLALLLACGTQQQPGRAPESSADSTIVPPDSLALATPLGEVWFTGARKSAGRSGDACLERVMEIRDSGRRVAIPLLYTGETPRLVDDSTIEAAIWLHCRPGNVYRVNLRTGLPVRVR